MICKCSLDYSQLRYYIATLATPCTFPTGQICLVLAMWWHTTNDCIVPKRLLGSKQDRHEACATKWHEGWRSLRTYKAAWRCFVPVLSSMSSPPQSYFNQRSETEDAFDDQNISAEVYLEIPGDVRLTVQNPFLSSLIFVYRRLTCHCSESRRATKGWV